MIQSHRDEGWRNNARRSAELTAVGKSCRAEAILRIRKLDLHRKDTDEDEIAESQNSIGCELNEV